MKTVRGYMKDESGDYINVLINNDEDILIKDFDFEDFCNIFNVDELEKAPNIFIYVGEFEYKNETYFFAHIKESENIINQEKNEENFKKIKEDDFDYSTLDISYYCDFKAKFITEEGMFSDDSDIYNREFI